VSIVFKVCSAIAALIAKSGLPYACVKVLIIDKSSDLLLYCLVSASIPIAVKSLALSNSSAIRLSSTFTSSALTAASLFKSIFVLLKSLKRLYL